MPRRITVVAGVVGGLLIGWIVGFSLTTASAQTNPPVVTCHYEIYGPTAACVRPPPSLRGADPEW